MNSLNLDFAILSYWFYRDFTVINPDKCSLCYLALKLNFQAHLVSIRNRKEEKVLGTIFDSKIDFFKHLTNITSKRHI